MASAVEDVMELSGLCKILAQPRLPMPLCIGIQTRSGSGNTGPEGV
jgi:hypothetical protein